MESGLQCFVPHEIPWIKKSFSSMGADELGPKINEGLEQIVGIHSPLKPMGVVEFKEDVLEVLTMNAILYVDDRIEAASDFVEDDLMRNKLSEGRSRVGPW